MISIPITGFLAETGQISPLAISTPENRFHKKIPNSQYNRYNRQRQSYQLSATIC